MLSCVLVEKTALGLAQPPPDDLPLERLRDAQRIECELAERAERARGERMQVRAHTATDPWTDYVLVTEDTEARLVRQALGAHRARR